jgi:hypothetical protein
MYWFKIILVVLVLSLQNYSRICHTNGKEPLNKIKKWGEDYSTDTVNYKPTK